ncbi:hypothetical protein [Streptomyces sp. NPDC046759]|uniref:hypothetical protein n=1 Tax=Streptomyces sp. NPDC046759 TaxID=3155019 RepID=UPI003409A4A5
MAATVGGRSTARGSAPPSAASAPPSAAGAAPVEPAVTSGAAVTATAAIFVRRFTTVAVFPQVERGNRTIATRPPASRPHIVPRAGPRFAHLPGESQA